MEFDYVHRRHGEPGSVHEASYAAVEADVVKVVLRRLNFARVLLRAVPVTMHLLLAELGIVIKIAHGWNSQATWYVARAVLGVLGINLRNPYPLHRQKAFIVPGIVPKQYLQQLETVVTWDEWDPDQDRFQVLNSRDDGEPKNPHANEGRM